MLALAVVAAAAVVLPAGGQNKTHTNMPTPHPWVHRRTIGVEYPERLSYLPAHGDLMSEEEILTHVTKTDGS